MKLALPLAATVLLTLAACGSNSDQPSPTETATDAAEATPVALTAQGFVEKLAASDVYETEAGKLAQEKGRTQEAKDFGAMMVKDHAASSEALKAVVKDIQPAITLEPKLSPDLGRKLDQLRGSGGNFDALYSLQQIGAHEETLKLLKDYSANGDNEALREYATKTASVVEHHLEEARKLP